MALDLPTQCGYDSDDAEYGEEVGRVGVAVDTLADAEILFDGIPLDKISTSFTINGTAAILLAFYVAAAEKKGVPRAKLTGTIQNDILKEYASRGTWIWPPEPSLRLIADTIEFCAAEVPRFNAISSPVRTSRCRRQCRAGDGVHVGRWRHVLRHRCRAGPDDHRSVRAADLVLLLYPRRLLREIAKYRAGRRRWATIVRERYGASTDKASMFRFGCVAGGASLYAPQAQNNLVRVAYEAMAAVLGGVQSMFTAAWDEPFALPSEESATLALRTQQILAYETGVTKVADPLAVRTSSRRSPTPPRPRSSRSCTISRPTAAWCARSRTGTCRASSPMRRSRSTKRSSRESARLSASTSSLPTSRHQKSQPTNSTPRSRPSTEALSKVKAERDPAAVKDALAALSRSWKAMTSCTS